MDDRLTIRLGKTKDIFFNALDGEKESNQSVTASHLARWCIQQSLCGQVSLNSEDARDLIEATRELKREMSSIGGNLNQLAHYFNMRGDLAPDELDRQHKALSKELKAIHKHIDAIHAQLRTAIPR